MARREDSPPTPAPSLPGSLDTETPLPSLPRSLAPSLPRSPAPSLALSFLLPPSLPRDGGGWVGGGGMGGEGRAGGPSGGCRQCRRATRGLGP